MNDDMEPPSRRGRERCVLVTGCEGQDGFYLCRQLEAENVTVVGVARTHVTSGTKRWPAIDLGDRSQTEALFRQFRPDACYHFAGTSTVAQCDAATIAFNRTSMAHLLRAGQSLSPHCRFLLAGSSHLFGTTGPEPLNEEVPMLPSNDYGRGKLAAHEVVLEARARGQFACTAILFNHESERRPPHFVSRKLSLAVAAIKRGRAREVSLGDLEARRDWGYAPEYTLGMRRMLAVDAPDDFVLATGRTHTVRELATAAFAAADLDANKFLRTDVALQRKNAAHATCGDPRRAERRLGWRTTCTMPRMMAVMVQHDLQAVGSARPTPKTS